MFYQIQLAARLGKAGAKWASAGFPVRTNAECAQCAEACQACRHWIDGRCKLCGCVTRWKIKMRTESCPVEKW